MINDILLKERVMYHVTHVHLSTVLIVQSTHKQMTNDFNVLHKYIIIDFFYIHE